MIKFNWENLTTSSCQNLSPNSRASTLRNNLWLHSYIRSPVLLPCARMCSTGSSVWSCPYVCIFVYYYVYIYVYTYMYIYIIWSKVTAVSHLCAQKTSPNLSLLVCLCIYMPPKLSATPGESQIKRYTSVFYLYAPIRSVPAGSWVSLFMRTHTGSQFWFALVHCACIQRTGLCVRWTLVFLMNY